MVAGPEDGKDGPPQDSKDGPPEDTKDRPPEDAKDGGRADQDLSIQPRNRKKSAKYEGLLKNGLLFIISNFRDIKVSNICVFLLTL